MSNDTRGASGSCHRRGFFKRSGLAGAATLAAAKLRWVPNSLRAEVDRHQPSAAPPRKRWLFWDLWKLDSWENLELLQGKPQFRPEASYSDPSEPKRGGNFPVVFFDQDVSLWRMFYSVGWQPYTLMLAESEDGYAWRPAQVRHASSDDAKQPANHLYTLAGGEAGAVYLDPIAADGNRFKLFGRRHGEAVFRRAVADPSHVWHEIASREGPKRYISESVTLGSRDGLVWEELSAFDWGRPDWHPEPPIFAYYNRQQDAHYMTVRPGWGDRRVCLRHTRDFQDWSPPELLFQMDTLDDQAPIGLYGMPVFPYGIGYVGLLWVFHNSSSQRVSSFNQFFGTMDAQLAFSYDGARFFRGRRTPFLERTPHPQHGCTQLRPSSLVETDTEIRIYSEAARSPHGLENKMQRTTEEPLKAVTLHTLRKDGFMYVASRGDWARMQSKPLAIWTPEILINAEARFGEVLYQITDEKSVPVEGFTFDDCAALQAQDDLGYPLAWKDVSLDAVVGKVIRLEFRWRNAKIYSLAASYHFLDAHDQWMLYDGKTIDTELFDF
jgi:hypothetical protein